MFKFKSPVGGYTLMANDTHRPQFLSYLSKLRISDRFKVMLCQSTLYLSNIKMLKLLLTVSDSLPCIN